jgi:hypothetical protein
MRACLLALFFTAALDAQLAETFQKLQSFKLEPSPYGPLETITPLNETYKRQLRELAERLVKASPSAAALKAALEKELRAIGIHPPRAEQEPRPYGLLSVEVARATEQPRVLAVLFHLNLAHGTNTALTIYSGTREVFRDDGDHIAPPQFTRSDASGSFLMLTASDGELSANGGYGLIVRLYRFDAQLRSNKFFDKEYSSHGHQIAIEPNGFKLEDFVMESDAMRGGYRLHPFRYELRGARLIRVEPIAFDAHDFVEEWGEMPWEEAARWSDTGNLAKLREVHEKVRDADGYFGGEFRAKVCGPQTRIWEIAFSRGFDGPVYFLVEQTGRWNFLLKEASSIERKGCVWDEGPHGTRTMFAKPPEFR